MKIIAHRGWSAGKDENTITAFQRAVDNGLNGVEFDIRWSADKKEIIISHDPADLNSENLSLREGFRFLADKNLELWIEMKEYDNNLFIRLTELLKEFNLIKKTIVFGFKEIAENFDWENREIELGIIIEYPWNINRNIKKYNPNSILMGWDDRRWTKSAFKILWSFFSFERLSKKYPKVKFVAGVVENKSDHDWISKQNGLYSCTVDNLLECR